MKLNNFLKSMRGKIFLYLMGFSSLMILFLWLFQVVFLDEFYQNVKSYQIKDTVNDIIERLDNYGTDNIALFLDSITENSDYCIRLTDFEGQYIYQNNSNESNSGFIGDNEEQIKEQVIAFYNKAKRNGGEITYIGNSARPPKPNGEDKPQFEEIHPPLKHEEHIDFKYMAYGKITTIEDNQYFVLINSRISMVSEIAETIVQQLFLIFVIVLILTLIFAYFMSKKIAKPIVETNEAAKKLAQGNLNVPFSVKGYLEIEELNETLSYAEDELNKIDGLRKELIANVSHDLRTPLTMIQGYSEIIRDIPQENNAENIQVIIDECKRLNTLVNDILELSRLQSNAQELVLSEFNITQEIMQVIERFNTLIKKEGYKICFDYDKEVVVKADQNKINRVLYNLLANAINYTGEDKKIKVKQSIENNIVRIEVSDNGEGIPEEHLAYVWDRYFKIDKVHKRPQIGTGLGLSIVKSVLEMHEATYGVTSKENEGTTFYFELKI